MTEEKKDFVVKDKRVFADEDKAGGNTGRGR